MMILALFNLPAGISEQQIRDLVYDDTRLTRIELTNEGNHDKYTAVLHYDDMSRIELNRLAEHFDGAVHFGRKLRAYSALFFK